MLFCFVHLSLHFLKQQESRSQDHLCEFKWKQRGCLRELGVFLPTHFHTWSTICQVTGLVADLGLAARRCSSPSLWLNLGKLGRKLSLLEPKENTWKGTQGSHGAQLKHRGPASQAAAPSRTQPMVHKWDTGVGTSLLLSVAARALSYISRGLWKVLISYRAIEAAAGQKK